MLRRNEFSCRKEKNGRANYASARRCRELRSRRAKSAESAQVVGNFDGLVFPCHPATMKERRQAYASCPVPFEALVMTTTNELTKKRCISCEAGAVSLAPEQVQGLLPAVPDWKLSPDGKRIRRDWRVRDFMTALEFFQRIAQIAEAEDHHPDLHLVGYRNVTIEIWTHAVGGLTENDFILAAKIDRLPVALKQ
jgi:4a-hydroxytetrahydrobiopterin dehydratase